ARLHGRRLFERGQVEFADAALGALYLLLILAPALLALSSQGGRPGPALGLGLAAHGLLLAPLCALLWARGVQSCVLAAEPADAAPAAGPRVAAPPDGADGERDAIATAAAEDGDGPPALYAAARRGEVERSLELLESGGYETAAP